MAAARHAVLEQWVDATYRPAYIDHFPPPGRVTGRPAPPLPFPECYPEHPQLVSKLQLMKDRADQLAAGTTDDGYRPEDWHRDNETLLLPEIALVARLCRAGHVALLAPERELEVPVSPPGLPGRVVPRPKAGPAVPTGWREYIPSPIRGREIEPGCAREAGGLDDRE